MSELGNAQRNSVQHSSASAGVAVRTGLHHVERSRLRIPGLPEPTFDLYIKAESEQPIGSFKLRGAYNMVAQLDPAVRSRGVITYFLGAATMRRVKRMRRERLGTMRR